METDEPRLLMEALRHLPDEDRERVLIWLLRYMAVGQRFPRELVIPDVDFPHTAEPVTLRGGGQQVVPMRFTTAEHARLRTWSEQHGFSMAAVVRGLVSRFLDSQPDARAQTNEGGQAESA